jgi:transcriptional regulator
MYIPKINKVEDQSEIIQFISTYNFSTVVSHENEMPIATHIPIENEVKNGELYLKGHLAKANPQWQTFRGDQNILLIFMEAHSYISSSWYEKVDVPTWNYMAIHAYGKPRLFNEAELLEFVTFQLNKYESSSQNPVKMEHLQPDTLNRNLRGIVGFELKVEKIEARYKLSQNKPAQTFDNVIQQLEKRLDENSHKIAEAMKKIKK